MPFIGAQPATTAITATSLSGVTSSTTELNILDGVTATAAELNILDGVTSTAAKLNLVDGSSAGTIVNSKAVIYGSSGEVNATTLQIAGTSITSTAAELNILDGVTATTAELNFVDGVTSNIQTQLDAKGTGTVSSLSDLSITATAAELNIMDGVTATTAELNYTDGVTSNIQTQLDSKVGANYTGDVNITGELLVDSYNETFKKVSSVTSTSYYDIANATYASKSLSVSQDSTPSDILFNGNGTKAYMLGYATDAIYQYSLSTAYDISTGSYDSVSFSVSSQDSVPLAMAWNSDGTKLYVAGSGNDSIFQYTLSTAYNLATASYSNVSLSISSQTTNPDGLFFKPDGTIMYLCSQNGAVYQYTLSTAFDLSTASYASKSLDVSGETSSARGVALSSDGLKVFIVDNTNDAIDQYNLSTAWDISTGSYASKTFSVTTQENFPMGLVFSPTGDKMYVVGTQNDTIYQYTTSFSSVSTTFDCENANVFETELDANTTVVFSNPPAAGTATDSTAYAMSLKVVQDSGASGYTVTWPTSIDWPAATAPTLTATASAVDQFVFYTYDGGTNWYGFTAGQALG